VPAPRFALSVLAVTFAGLAAAQSLGVSPAWVAVSGALVLTVPMLRRAPARTAAALVRAANPAFCAFVFGLGVVVLAVRDSDVGDAVGRLLPGRADLPGLLVTAVVACTAGTSRRRPPSSCAWAC
jgi:arsenical pump membrane protein